MKIWKLFILALVTSFSAQAQTCPAPPDLDKAAIPGQWEGTYTYEGNTYDLIMQVRLVGDQLVTRCTVEGLDLENRTFTTWICASNEVHMRLDLEEGKAVKLVGRPDGDQWTGRFVYNDRPGTCGDNSNAFAMTKVAAIAHVE